MGGHEAVLRVRAAVRAALAPHERVVLAVSGGRDSMVLLDAAFAGTPARVSLVATFDHATGAHAGEAAALVAAKARALGGECVTGRAGRLPPTEQAWRDARWAFLRDAARQVEADVVATGHTRDDQLETVAMRVLRDAGARGLAGLHAPTRDVVRPLIGIDARTLVEYASARAIDFVEDPTNASRRYLRNRVRHELLPALERASPGVSDSLLAIAETAAAWRAEVEALVDRDVSVERGASGELGVALDSLRGHTPDALAILWPAIAARAGVRLDRRGTRRLAEFTTRILERERSGARIQLAGGVEVMAASEALKLRRSGSKPSSAPPEVERPLDGDTCFGSWRFVRGRGGIGAWSALLPPASVLTVRAWRPGDRMVAAGASTARRVKRFLADARVAGPDRVGWPVVVSAGEIVWIPGVRRSDAATDRPGAPGIRYSCERIDG